jgi:hypothetical protein
MELKYSNLKEYSRMDYARAHISVHGQPTKVGIVAKVS